MEEGRKRKKKKDLEGVSSTERGSEELADAENKVCISLRNVGTILM